MGIIKDISLWSANMLNLESEIMALDEIADMYHIDISDTYFTNNMIFSLEYIKAIKKVTSVPLHIHLMMNNPINIINEINIIGTGCVTLHLENGELIYEALDSIKCKKGLAICIDTPIELVDKYLNMIDMIVVMGTEIGVKGQEISDNVISRIKKVRDIIGNKNIKIEVDGGIRMNSLKKLIESNVDSIAFGSIMFKNRKEVIELLDNHNKGKVRNE